MSRIIEDHTSNLKKILKNKNFHLLESALNNIPDEISTKVLNDKRINWNFLIENKKNDNTILNTKFPNINFYTNHCIDNINFNEEKIIELFKKAFNKGLKIYSYFFKNYFCNQENSLISYALLYKRFNLLDFFLDKIDQNDKDYIDILNNDKNSWYILFANNTLDYFTLNPNIFTKDITSKEIISIFDLEDKIFKLFEKAFSKGLKIDKKSNLIGFALYYKKYNLLDFFLDKIDQNNKDHIKILNASNHLWGNLILKNDSKNILLKLIFDTKNNKISYTYIDTSYSLDKKIELLNKAFEKGLNITYLENCNIDNLFIILSYALYKKDYNSLNLFLDSINQENKENVNFLNNNISILNIIISGNINLELKKELFKKAFQKGFIINKENFISLCIYMIIFFQPNLFNFFFEYSNNYNLNFQNSDLNNVQYYLKYFSDNNNSLKNYCYSQKLQADVKDIISKKIQNIINITSNNLPLDKIYYLYIYNKFTNMNNIIYSQTYKNNIIEISYYMIYNKDKNKYKLYFFPLSENNINIYYPFEENESEKVLIPIFDHNNPNNIICYLTSSIKGPDYTKESLPRSEIILKKDIIEIKYNPCFDNSEYI